jgi:hypothetical protein
MWERHSKSVLPIGTNFGRKTQKWPLKNVSVGKKPPTIFFADLKNGLKVCYSHKTFILGRNRLFNTLKNSTFLLTFCDKSLWKAASI